MIDKVVFQILNMSFASSFAIIFVLFARLILKKVPKVFSYTLWSVVLFRLICPVSFESTFSLLPINVAPVPIATIYSESPQISTGIAAFDHAIHSILPVPSATASSNPLQIWIFVGEIVWLAGMALLIGHSVASLMRLRQKLIGAVMFKAAWEKKYRRLWMMPLRCLSKATISSQSICLRVRGICSLTANILMMRAT